MALLIKEAKQVTTRYNSSPQFKLLSTTCTETASYITSPTEILTKIDFYGSPVQALRVNSQPFVPTTAGASVTTAITLSSIQKITSFVATIKDAGANEDLVQMVFTFTNPGTTPNSIGAACTGTGCDTYTFTTPSGYDLVGFGACTDTAGEIHSLGAYYRQIDCSLTTNIGLSFSGPSSRIVYDGANDATLTLVATDLTFGSCLAFEVSVSYTPATTTPGIIVIESTQDNSPSTHQKTVTVKMKKSENLLDAGVYTISFSAKYPSHQTNWLTSATSTYTYLGCDSATITSFDISDFTVNYGTPNSGSAGGWYDSVSGSTGDQANRCGGFSSTTTITRTSGVVDTSIFVYSTT